MKTMTNKTKGLLAGVLLMISPTVTLISGGLSYAKAGVPFSAFGLSLLVVWLVPLFLSVSLIVDRIKLARAAAVVSFIICLIMIFSLITGRGGNDLRTAVGKAGALSWLELLTSVLLLLALFTLHKPGKLMCFAAAGLVVVKLIISCVGFEYSFLQILGTIFSSSLFTIAGYILLGYYLEEKALAPERKGSAAASGLTDVEKLSQLMDLLDKGIITQEEFDAKKKQLLGL